jgi:flagellar basal-body rod modification protein FlgD
MITALDRIPQASKDSQGAAAKVTSTKKTLGKEDFLSLLVAQLKNQDPASPMQGTEFTAQLAQFSSLEQLTNVNANLKTLGQAQNATNTASMISLIGKKVDVPGNKFEHKSGAIDGLKFSLADNADKVEVQVFDANGKQVATVTQANVAAGSGNVQWNGKDSNGRALAEGTYSFSVKAVDATGKDIQSATYTSGTVTDVEFVNGEVFAVVNGQKISTSEITRVSL